MRTRRPAVAWVIAGAPGAGKSTVADLVLERLDPVPALLDKDTLYGSFVTAALRAAGRPLDEREGPWYDVHIKAHEYGGMAAAAAEIRSYGCPVLLGGPFTTQVHDPSRWLDWVVELGGQPVCLIWVRSDPETLWERLRARDLPRDGQKLERFEQFCVATRPDRPPAVAYQEIDNRAGAKVPLAEQVDRALARYAQDDAVALLETGGPGH